MTEVVVDTNVLLVANGAHVEVSPECRKSCVKRLEQIQQSGIVAIDDEWRILREYQKKTQPNQPKGVGDVFLKWLLRNLSNPARCHQVTLTEPTENRFTESPSEPLLANFDPSDRKFVAVAAAHPRRPPILQAADSKWLGWEAALKTHHVVVDFICRSDIVGFQGRAYRDD